MADSTVLGAKVELQRWLVPRVLASALVLGSLFIGESPKSAARRSYKSCRRQPQLEASREVLDFFFCSNCCFCEDNPWINKTCPRANFLVCVLCCSARDHKLSIRGRGALKIVLYFFPFLTCAINGWGTGTVLPKSGSKSHNLWHFIGGGLSQICANLFRFGFHAE